MRAISMVLGGVLAGLVGCVESPDDGGDTDGGDGSGGQTASSGATTSAGTSAGSASGSGSTTGSASEGSTATSAASAEGSTSEGDGCDCQLGAYVPACGIDGTSYDATCGTQCVPVPIACMTECPCAELECGEQTCGPDEPVCTIVSGGAKGSGSTADCGPIPEPCGDTPSCACLEDRACSCTEPSPGRFRVLCSAP